MGAKTKKTLGLEEVEETERFKLVWETGEVV